MHSGSVWFPDVGTRVCSADRCLWWASASKTARLMLAVGYVVSCLWAVGFQPAVHYSVSYCVRARLQCLPSVCAVFPLKCLSPGFNKFRTHLSTFQIMREKDMGTKKPWLFALE